MDFIEEYKRIKQISEKIYIYGTGLYGRRAFQMLRKYDCRVDGFITSKEEEIKKLYNLPIHTIDKLNVNDIGIVLAMNIRNSHEVMELLKHYNVEEKRIMNAGTYIGSEELRSGYGMSPSIEITTVLGCSVNCKYCPQSVLLNSYYEKDKSREKIMSMETFEKCLDKLPIDCNVMFAGMAEALLNPNCIKMVEKTIESGRIVDFYTTLVGATEQDIELLCKLPINYFTLHMADKYGYAHIPVSEQYYSWVERLINSKRPNGKPVVDLCNAQAEPDDRIKQICEGKYEISTELLDRAGNLHDEILYSKKNMKGEIRCGFCGPELNHNVLLPDGTVLLCCMDYGMKHVLGNLKLQTYDELMDSKVMRKIKEGMSGNFTFDVLCRSCTCSIKK